MSDLHLAPGNLKRFNSLVFAHQDRLPDRIQARSGRHTEGAVCDQAMQSQKARTGSGLNCVPMCLQISRMASSEVRPFR